VVTTEQSYAMVTDKSMEKAMAVFDGTTAIAFRDPEVKEFVEDVYALLQANPGVKLPKRMLDRINQLKADLNLEGLEMTEAVSRMVVVA